MKKMRRIPGESIAVTAENFAKHLHDRWGVGKAGCDDGAVLLLSITDRQIYVSTGRRAMMVLTNDQIDFLINLTKPFLEEKSYDTSVRLAVERMRQVFSATKLRRATETKDASGLIIFCGIVFVALYIFWWYKDYPSPWWYLLDKLLSGRDQLPQSSFSESFFMNHGHFGEVCGGFGGGTSIGGGGRGGSW